MYLRYFAVVKCLHFIPIGPKPQLIWKYMHTTIPVYGAVKKYSGSYVSLIKCYETR